MRLMFGMILCLTLVVPAFAVEPSHMKAAEDLMSSMNIDKQYQEMTQNMSQMQEQQLQSSGMTPEQIAAAKKSMDTIMEEMSWDKMKAEYTAVYTKMFTEEELKGLADFYKSPLGKKFIDSMPELSKDLMEISQKRATELMPKMMDAVNAAKGPETATSAPATTPAVETSPATAK